MCGDTSSAELPVSDSAGPSGDTANGNMVDYSDSESANSSSSNGHDASWAPEEAENQELKEESIQPVQQLVKDEVGVTKTEDSIVNENGVEYWAQQFVDSGEVLVVGERLVGQKRKLEDEVKHEPNGSMEVNYARPPSGDDNFKDDDLMRELQQKARHARELVQERHRLLNEATAELRVVEELIADRHSELRRAADAAFDWNSHSFPWDDVLAKEMADVFQIRSFRPLQREALNATLSGRDVYAILSTGAGKSLIYQLAAVVDRGLTLVVTPLIALSLDQQKALRRLNIRAESLDSTIPKSISKHIFEHVVPKNGNVRNSSHPRKKLIQPQKKARKKSVGQLTWIRDDMETTILFVTPEQIVRSKRLMNRVEMMYEKGHLSRIVIDEAHCCSIWGHDYRPDYRKLGTLKRQCPQTPIIALSATSSPETTEDVCKMLETPSSIIFRGSINRPNLFYEVRRKKDDEDEVISDIASIVLSEFKDQCGIVYVLSRREAETYALKLQEMGITSGCYHGDMEQGERTRVHGSWHRGDVQVVVATIAFGLGIDNPHVRFVLHATLASSMEGYYQESGRAGRDGNPAKCIVLHRPKDFARMSAFVADKGDARITKMYEMYQYSSSRAYDAEGEEQVAACRRVLIAKAFQEKPPPRSQEGRATCCDLCAGLSNRVDQPILTDVTTLAQSVTRILIHQNNTRPNEKITILALATGWGNRGAKGRVMRGEEPAADRALTLELRLEIIIGLIFKGALQEFHRHTAHAVNAYVTEGPKSAEILQEGAVVNLVLRSGDARIVNSL